MHHAKLSIQLDPKVSPKGNCLFLLKMSNSYDHYFCLLLTSAPLPSLWFFCILIFAWRLSLNKAMQLVKEHSGLFKKQCIFPLFYGTFCTFSCAKFPNQINMPARNKLLLKSLRQFLRFVKCFCITLVTSALYPHDTLNIFRFIFFTSKHNCIWACFEHKIVNTFWHFSFFLYLNKIHIYEYFELPPGRPRPGSGKTKVREVLHAPG